MDTPTQTPAKRFDPNGQAIKHTRVDEISFAAARDSCGAMNEAFESQYRTKLPGPVVESFGFDAFNLLAKHRPQDSGNGSALARDLANRLRKHDQYYTLRQYTVGDDLAAALGVASIAREVCQATPDEVQKAAKNAAEAKAEADDAKALAEMMASDENADPSDIIDQRENAERAEARANAAASDLGRAISENGASMAKVVDRAMGKAVDDAQAVKQAARLFGLGSSEAMGGLPVSEKIRLANAVKNAGPKFRRLLEILGRETSTALDKQAAKCRHDSGAIVDITLGDDPARLLDEELVELCARSRPRRLLAMARLADAAAASYEVEHKEPQGRGPIIILLDESGSMSGQNEAKAKAISLALANVAARQNRDWACVCFQGSVTAEFSVLARDASTRSAGISLAERTLAAFARRGTGGGTNFDPPLWRAADMIVSAKYERADVLMLTDGEGPIGKSTIDRLNSLRATRGASIFAMLIGCSDHMAKQTRTFADKVWSSSCFEDAPVADIYDSL
ncbi:hypothetical protein UFOVP329_48 [uncultured Caudovirales phage]|uniref:VWFA domain-containing protein n=1 Tax=uncultured Caudovirales phage TaxID=2100421 RepID=A0A6J5LZK8_9CAUD|nr:hypothetical protein UFOVP329_48 [uncultured Caudovirales phage]